MRKGPNPQIFVLLAIGALVLGGAASFFAFSGLSSAKASLQKLQADSKDATALRKALADSEASLQDSSSKLQHLEQGVQDYAYVPTLLSELDKLGKASGISVVGVRPLPKPVVAPKKDDSGQTEKVKKKAYDEIDIEVKGRGNYRSVMTFIQALGKFPKIVAARTIELTPKNEPGQNTSDLDVTVSLRAYVFPTPTADSSPQGQKTAMATGSNHEG
ncbi:MAG TPA: type 4a pilus biogenesis protein PilO [Fimbriimonadaceae bacterium]|nr:type 4a pilus biogenesis protein PilO [Fimbriimonadaceae bacterium]